MVRNAGWREVGKQALSIFSQAAVEKFAGKP